MRIELDYFVRSSLAAFYTPLLAFREPLLQLHQRLVPVRDLVLHAFSIWLVSYKRVSSYLGFFIHLCIGLLAIILKDRVPACDVRYRYPMSG